MEHKKKLKVLAFMEEVNFIDKHKGNDKIALCGKLAIVRSILHAEKNSKLYFDKDQANATINFKNKELSKSWYMSFFKILTEDCTKNDLIERFKNITLIIFNYDRCVEHFLYCALQCCYEVNKSEAAELVESINIFHPYGSVGTLPWLHENGNTEFGSDPETQKLLELAQEIKTFTEGTDPKSSRIDQLKFCMGTAQKFVFLGFAFHKLNMQLMTPKVGELVSSRPICFATTFGFSDHDQSIIIRKISNLLSRTNRTSPSITVSSSTCGDFFNEFSQTLSFG